jgi:hypothetical protein
MASGNLSKKRRRKEQRAMATKVQQGANGPNDKGKGTTHSPAKMPGKAGSSGRMK